MVVLVAMVLLHELVQVVQLVLPHLHELYLHELQARQVQHE